MVDHTVINYEYDAWLDELNASQGEWLYHCKLCNSYDIEGNYDIDGHLLLLCKECARKEGKLW